MIVFKIYFYANKFSSIYLTKGEKRLVFRQSFVNPLRAKDVIHVFDAKYRYVFLVQIHQIARLVSHLIIYFSKWVFTVSHENATQFRTKNDILRIFFISSSDFLWLYYYGFMHNFI